MRRCRRKSIALAAVSRSRRALTSTASRSLHAPCDQFNFSDRGAIPAGEETITLQTQRPGGFALGAAADLFGVLAVGPPVGPGSIGRPRFCERKGHFVDLSARAPGLGGNLAGRIAQGHGLEGFFNRIPQRVVIYRFC
jgi:hypothetical protein